MLSFLILQLLAEKKMTEKSFNITWEMAAIPQCMPTESLSFLSLSLSLFILNCKLYGIKLSRSLSLLFQVL